MKRYALVNEEGEVVDVAMWDGETAWDPGEGLTAIEDPDGVAGSGVRYENGQFIVPDIVEEPLDLEAMDLEQLTHLLTLQGSPVRALAQVQFTILNEVRELQGKPPLTAAQYKTHLKGLMRD